MRLHIHMPIDELKKAKLGDNVELRIRGRIVELADVENEATIGILPCGCKQEEDNEPYMEIEVAEVRMRGGSKIDAVMEDDE